MAVGWIFPVEAWALEQLCERPYRPPEVAQVASERSRRLVIALSVAVGVADFLQSQEKQPVLSTGALSCLQQLEASLSELFEGLFVQIVLEPQIHHMVDLSVRGENTCSAVDFQKLVALRDGDHGIHARGEQGILNLSDVHGVTLPAARRSSQATS